ncbi:Hypothetical predicted protein [Mytilus galloprovincialis]|nr:Hypothetical predicted protein [Mytilus galloprovincialis]VDI28137.1 Hypothetical predicted protein [Mytilus galloprovincialis]
MPSGGMRVNPWKVRTGTEDPIECNGHARESSRIVSGYEDVLGYRDNQGFSQGSNVTNNRYENNLRTHPLINFAHNSNSAYARGNKKAAATYDGLGSWQDYIVHFEMIAEINGWDENTKALELATCLRGSAQAILSDLRPDLRRSYAHLVAALTSRFQPSNQAELYRAQMKGKSRNKDQSLPELAQDIKRVTRLAYPTAPIEVREQLARDCFIDSLNDADLEWAIFQGKPNSIDDSVRMGLEFEAFNSGHRRKFNSRAALRMQSSISDDEEGPEIHMNSIIDRLAKIENSQSQQKPSFKSEATCYFCGIKGHYKRDCRKFQEMRNSGKYVPNNRTGNKWSQGTQTDTRGQTKSGNF